MVFSGVYVGMFQGHKDRHDAILAFAVTICLLIVGLIGWYEGFKRGQESHQSYSAEAYQSQADSQIAETCSRLSGVAMRECIAQAVRSTREQQRAEQDLDAQQQMSEWAKWMLIATVLMAVITLFGVVFVWKTLVATRLMVSDAREIGEAQTTSYLTVEYVITRPSDQVIIVEYFVKNVGKTPAHQVKMTAKVKPCNVSEGKGVDTFSKPKTQDLNAIAGGAVSHSYLSFMNIEDPDFFGRWPPRGETIIGADIELVWIDVFGMRHKAWFFMADRDSDFHNESIANGTEYHQKMYVSRSTFVKIGRQRSRNED